jgi:hypothetical protein
MFALVRRGLCFGLIYDGVIKLPDYLVSSSNTQNGKILLAETIQTRKKTSVPRKFDHVGLTPFEVCGFEGEEKFASTRNALRICAPEITDAESIELLSAGPVRNYRSVRILDFEVVEAEIQIIEASDFCWKFRVCFENEEWIVESERHAHNLHALRQFEDRISQKYPHIRIQRRRWTHCDFDDFRYPNGIEKVRNWSFYIENRAEINQNEKVLGICVQNVLIGFVHGGNIFCNHVVSHDSPLWLTTRGTQEYFETPEFCMEKKHSMKISQSLVTREIGQKNPLIIWGEIEEDGERVEFDGPLVCVYDAKTETAHFPDFYLCPVTITKTPSAYFATVFHRTWRLLTTYDTLLTSFLYSKIGDLPIREPFWSQESEMKFCINGIENDILVEYHQHHHRIIKLAKVDYAFEMQKTSIHLQKKKIISELNEEFPSDLSKLIFSFL